MFRVIAHVRRDETFASGEKRTMEQVEHFRLNQSAVGFALFTPGLRKLNENRFGESGRQMVGENEPGIAADEPNILDVRGCKLASGRRQSRAMHLDADDSMIRVTLREVDEVISHAKADLDQGGTFFSERSLDVDLFAVSENDPVVFPAVLERPLLSLRQLPLIAQVAGGPPEAAVAFQIRHDKRRQTKIAT